MELRSAIVRERVLAVASVDYQATRDQLSEVGCPVLSHHVLAATPAVDEAVFLNQRFEPSP